MQVEFCKTSEKSYAVVVLRKGLPDLKMDPAPGFDPLMPHDMLHFLVEQELRLRRGIFGQLELGGTAGTFRQPTASNNSNKRAKARLRRKSAKRNKNLSKQSDDYDESERATVICLYDWLSHSKNAKLKNRANEMKLDADSTLSRMPKNEKASLNKKKLAEIRVRMDEISQQWSNLKVGEFIGLDW